MARKLFGGPCRIILAALAWEKGAESFTQKEARLAADLHGSNSTQMGEELPVFVELGLLEESRGQRRNDPVHYGVLKDHPMWTPLLTIVDAFGLIEDDVRRPWDMP